MAETVKAPGFVGNLVAALQKRLPDAEIDVERIGRTNRYRLVVVSKRFQRMRHPGRQNLVWDVAAAVLKPEELLRTGMILTISPEELASYHL